MIADSPKYPAHEKCARKVFFQSFVSNIYNPMILECLCSVVKDLMSANWHIKSRKEVRLHSWRGATKGTGLTFKMICVFILILQIERRSVKFAHAHYGTESQQNDMTLHCSGRSNMPAMTAVMSYGLWKIRLHTILTRHTTHTDSILKSCLWRNSFDTNLPCGEFCFISNFCVLFCLLSHW